MNIRRFYIGRTIGLIVVVFLIGGFFLFNNYIYQEKQAEDVSPVSYRATLEGEYVCLSQTEDLKTECEPGIKTTVGEYYAINFFLMSQIVAPLEIGQQFSASGVVNTDSATESLQEGQFNIDGTFSVTDSVVLINVDNEPYECTADAQLCSDGSYVGRQGPDCKFAACPSSDNSSVKAITMLGRSLTAMEVTVSPEEIVSDSRCPEAVECIWAGTVEVRTTLATQVAHGEHVLALGEPQIFGDYTVTLVDVLPVKTEKTIPKEEYKLTFEVKN